MRRSADNGIRRLYHYEPLQPAYLCDTLREQRVHFSSPANFNDPWDCHPWFDPTEVRDPTRRAQWIAFLERHINPADEQFLASHGLAWRDNLAFLTRTIEKMTATICQVNAERWRIYCLTPHPDSQLMWAHYGDKHRGICIELDTTIPLVGRAAQVTYHETFAPISSASFEDWGRVAATLLAKSEAWAYEDE